MNLWVRKKGYEKMLMRKQTVENPFGTIKRAIKFRGVKQLLSP